MNQVLMVQHIVYGHCHLFATSWRNSRSPTPYACLRRLAKPMAPSCRTRRQRDDAERVDAVLLHPLVTLASALPPSGPARGLAVAIARPNRRRFVERLFGRRQDQPARWLGSSAAASISRGSWSERDTKFTCTTRGRRRARSRNNSADRDERKSLLPLRAEPDSALRQSRRERRSHDP
jgi:hypothetical protein